eukprot:Tbor_TRINITY_DN4828_c0_g1::TRINITY_DN4828_c0_g1_i1::g.1509::m.1509
MGCCLSSQVEHYHYCNNDLNDLNGPQRSDEEYRFRARRMRQLADWEPSNHRVGAKRIPASSFFLATLPEITGHGVLSNNVISSVFSGVGYIPVHCPKSEDVHISSQSTVCDINNVKREDNSKTSKYLRNRASNILADAIRKVTLLKDDTNSTYKAYDDINRKETFVDSNEITGEKLTESLVTASFIMHDKVIKDRLSTRLSLIKTRKVDCDSNTQKHQQHSDEERLLKYQCKMPNRSLSSHLKSVFYYEKLCFAAGTLQSLQQMSHIDSAHHVFGVACLPLLHPLAEFLKAISKDQTFIISEGHNIKKEEVFPLLNTERGDLNLSNSSHDILDMYTLVDVWRHAEHYNLLQMRGGNDGIMALSEADGVVAAWFVLQRCFK